MKTYEALAYFPQLMNDGPTTLVFAQALGHTKNAPTFAFAAYSSSNASSQDLYMTDSLIQTSSQGHQLRENTALLEKPCSHHSISLGHSLVFRTFVLPEIILFSYFLVYFLVTSH